MSDTRCLFCTHDNPVGSRFCNDCGSPLHLKPCPQCEAVSDFEAGACHQCGFQFVVSPTDTQGAYADAAIADAPAELAAVEQTAGVSRDSGPAHVPESFAASLGTHEMRIGDIARGTLVPATAGERRRLFALPRRALVADAPLEALRARRAHHVIIAATLVVAAGALAYFVYRPHAALNSWLAELQLDVLRVVPTHVAATPAATKVPPANAPPATADTGEPRFRDAAPVVATPTNAEPPVDAPAVGDDDAGAGRAEATTDSSSARASESPPAADAATERDDGRSQRAPQSSAAVTAPASTRAGAKMRSTTPGRADARPTRAVPPPQRPSAAALSPPAEIVQSPPIAVERPCTREVAALGLCRPSGSP